MTNPVPADQIRLGDSITAQFNDTSDPAQTFIITGPVCGVQGGDLHVAGWIVAESNGNPGPALLCVIDRVPAEPPIGTALFDEDGDLWMRLSDGWFMFAKRSFDTSPVKWSSISTNHDLKPVTE